VTAVADGPSGAAGNTESLGLFVERLESNKVGGFGELPDLRRLPCDFRWAHKLHLSFVFFMRCKPIVTGLVLSSIVFVTASAQAQVIVDVSKITCDQYVHAKITTPNLIAAWPRRLPGSV
jgi:hypothetical protein